MVSQRRIAQLGILAATAVFVGSFGVLVARSISDKPEAPIHLPALAPADAQPAAYINSATTASDNLRADAAK